MISFIFRDPAVSRSLKFFLNESKHQNLPFLRSLLGSLKVGSFNLSYTLFETQFRFIRAICKLSATSLKRSKLRVLMLNFLDYNKLTSNNCISQKTTQNPLENYHIYLTECGILFTSILINTSLGWELKKCQDPNPEIAKYLSQ